MISAQEARENAMRFNNKEENIFKALDLLNEVIAKASAFGNHLVIVDNSISNYIVDSGILDDIIAILENNGYRVGCRSDKDLIIESGIGLSINWENK